MPWQSMLVPLAHCVCVCSWCPFVPVLLLGKPPWFLGWFEGLRDPGNHAFQHPNFLQLLPSFGTVLCFSSFLQFVSWLFISWLLWRTPNCLERVCVDDGYANRMYNRVHSEIFQGYLEYIRFNGWFSVIRAVAIHPTWCFFVFSNPLPQGLCQYGFTWPWTFPLHSPLKERLRRSGTRCLHARPREVRWFNWEMLPSKLLRV